MPFWEDVWEVAKNVPFSAGVAPRGRPMAPPMTVNQFMQPLTEKKQAARMAQEMEASDMLPAGTAKGILQGRLSPSQLDFVQKVYAGMPISRRYPGLGEQFYPPVAPASPSPPSDVFAMPQGSVSATIEGHPASPPVYYGPPETTADPSVHREAQAQPTANDPNAYYRKLLDILPASQIGTVFQDIAARDAARQHALEQQQMAGERYEQQQEMAFQQHQYRSWEHEDQARAKAEADRVKSAALPKTSFQSYVDQAHNELYPGRPGHTLGPQDRVRVESRARELQQASELKSFESKQDYLLQRKRKELAAKGEEDKRVAMLALGQIRDMGSQIFTVSGPAPDATTGQKLASIWERMKQSGMLAQDAFFSGDRGSIINAYNEGIGIHVLSIVRALANTGRITNQEMQMVEKAIPRLRMGPGNAFLPDTKQDFELKVRNLENLLTRVASKPAYSVQPMAVNSWDQKQNQALPNPMTQPVSLQDVGGGAGQQQLQDALNLLEQAAQQQE